MAKPRPKSSLRKARPIALPADASVRDAAYAALVEIGGHYADNLAPLGSLFRAPERVHQLRVALRRLRTALAAFRPLLGKDRTRVLAREARAEFRALGAVRDLDVLQRAPLLAALPAQGKTMRARALASQRKARADSAQQRLGRPRAQHFARTLASLPLTLPADTLSARAPAVDLFRERLTRLHRRFTRGVADAADGDLSGLHDLRKEGKRLRYTAELAAPLFPDEVKRARALLRALEKLQDVLGAHVDGLLALRTLAAIDPSPAVRDALEASRAEAERTLPAALQKRAKAVLAAEPFW